MAKIAPRFGPPLMPWQRLVADTALEVDPATGRLVHGLVVVTVQRQAGKTTLTRSVLMRPMLTRPDASVWLTAQRRKDARKTWLKAAKTIERGPLAKHFTVRRTNGSECITFHPTGAEYAPFAPVEDALHGETTDVVVVDEGWAFNAERGEVLMQAASPTQITVANGQIWIVSTAGTARSEWLRAYVDQARAALGSGDDPGFCYFEWGIPDDADLEDLRVYAAAHPAYNHTIDMAGLVKARKNMPKLASFARAYGNRWATADDYLIDPVTWEDARTLEPLRPAPMALAVETATDGSRTVIVAAGELPGGRPAMEVIETRAAGAGAAARLIELAQRFDAVAVVVDPHSPAAPILRELHKLTTRRRRPLRLLEVTAGDYVEAWTVLREDLRECTVAHRSHQGLDKAADVATTRMVREQRVLSRVGACELVAGMLALHGLRNPPPLLVPRLMVANAPPAAR